MPRIQSAIQKFGKANVTTSLTDINLSGNHTWNSSNQSMEVVSSSANDTVVGSGARKVRVEGVFINADGLFELAYEIVELNGTTPVVLSTEFREVNTMYVVEYGSYVTTSAGATHGTITLRLENAGATQCAITNNTLPAFSYNQNQDARYTVPHIWWDGSEVLYYELKTAVFIVESAKVVTLQGFIRPDAHLTSLASPPRVVHEFIGAQSMVEIKLNDIDAWRMPTGMDFWGSGYVTNNEAKVGLLMTFIPYLK